MAPDPLKSPARKFFLFFFYSRNTLCARTIAARRLIGWASRIDAGAGAGRTGERTIDCVVALISPRFTAGRDLAPEALPLDARNATRDVEREADDMRKPVFYYHS